jgi:hypothetical protein
MYNYLCNQCLSSLMLRVRISTRARCKTLCDKVFRGLATDRWFSPGLPVSSTNKTDRHEINEILLKVALSTIKQTVSVHDYGFTISMVSCSRHLYSRFVFFLSINIVSHRVLLTSTTPIIRSLYDSTSINLRNME